MLLQYIALFCFECPQPLGISRVDRWNNFYLSALAEYDKNWQECPHAKFLLTRLLRGATTADTMINDRSSISTHTPHAGRDDFRLKAWKSLWISTHTPLARRDAILMLNSILTAISTHTPLTRRDSYGAPRLPVTNEFLLTRLLRGATKLICRAWSAVMISTHTPLARRDYCRPMAGFKLIDFYSHASCEARLLRRCRLRIDS